MSYEKTSNRDAFIKRTPITDETMRHSRYFSFYSVFPIAYAHLSHEQMFFLQESEIRRMREKNWKLADEMCLKIKSRYSLARSIELVNQINLLTLQLSNRQLIFG